jgi:catechol 2,3-dioxygenase-like lactoylglutathione lyase family enzyme
MRENHTGICVSGMERSVALYEGILGLELTEAKPPGTYSSGELGGARLGTGGRAADAVRSGR